MSRFKLYFSIFSLCFNFCYAQISDKRLCIDEKCSSPVSDAKTLTRYFAKDSYHLSFEPNEKVVIYSKSAGSKENLWGAEIKGKRGYIPKDLVRETKIHGKPLLLVDTEINRVSNVPQVPEKKESVRPSKVKLSYDVIDGTTIYIQPEDNVYEGTQDEAVESVTDGLVSSISDFKNVTVLATDRDVEDETLQIKTSSVSSDNENLVENVYSNNAEKDQEDKNIKIGEFDQNNTPELKDQKLDKIVVEHDKINAVENNMMNNTNEDNKFEYNEEIKNKQSSESGQPDSDDTRNFSGIFGDVLGMVMGAIEGEDTAEVNETEEIEQFEENENDEEVVSSDDEFEQEDSKSDVSTASTTQETENLQDSSETSETESTVDINPIIQENFSQQNDKLQPIIESKNVAKNILTSNIEESKIKEAESNMSSKIMNENKEISEEAPNSVEEIVIPQVLASNELIKNETKSSENTSANNDEKVVGQQEVLLSLNKMDNLEEPTQTIKDFADGEKVSVDSNLPYLHEKKIDSNIVINTIVDNTSFPDSNISLSKESLIANSDETKSIFPQVSQHSFDRESFDDSKNTKDDLNSVNNNIEDAENIHTTEPETFDKDSNIPSVSSEINYNKPDNQDIETSYKSNEVKPEEFTPTPEFKHFEKSSIENIIGSDNKHEDKLILDEILDDTENQEHKDHFGKDEIKIQKHEHNKDIESPGIFSYFGNIQNSAKLNTDASTDNILEDDTKHVDNFKENEIESQDHEELGHYLDKDENESREHMNENNIEVLQESSQIFSNFGNSDAVQKEELSSSNYDEINTEYSKNLVNDDVDVEREQNYIGSFITLVDLPILNSDFFLYLITTAVSVIIFLLGYFALDKSRREAPLVAKINKLEKEFLIVLKEKELLAEEIENRIQSSEYIESPDFLNLQKQYEDAVKEQQSLKEEIQTLEKELENSTEVGLELNRMLSDILSSENAGAILMSNIEGLQAQLVEQQGIVSNMKEILSLKETENHELHLELEIANKKVVELQSELDRQLLNIIKIEEEKDSQERKSVSEITELKMKIDDMTKKIENNEEKYTEQINQLKNNLSTSERNLQLKIKEFNGLKGSVQQIKHLKNVNTLDSLLEVTSIRAELDQMKTECHSHCEKLKYGQETNAILEKKAKTAEDEVDAMKRSYDEVDKARLELETKLQVLTNYFKDKEAQLQRELSKYESMWSAKQGEATSTSEQIKYLQSEIQNYKAQNESLKQEIVSQEVELKSQISVLEKKVHENWVSARQSERRLEDLKQEAAHLRNRLTLRERALQEDKLHNRIQNPLEQKVELPVSPLHLDSPSSPPLLYNSRDHITKSPPILGMPPPFLPPPPGNPFLPPPHLPFMPPPLSDMFPGDRRPPPLGRMSSPPLNSRYSPDRRPYSPYERRSPSPSFDESEYGTSPVRHRRYSPFSNRVDHRRMGRMNGRNGELSSGSGNSNESINELNHSNTKV